MIDFGKNNKVCPYYCAKTNVENADVSFFLFEVYLNYS
jgi:chromosome transmission fidelity protein 1